jgi:hypothetical protein
MLKPVPPAAIVETSTSELPVLLMTKVLDTELPAATVPKLRLVELKESAFVAAAPVPLSDKVAGEFGALLRMDTLPAADPAAAGRNCTLKVLDVPGLKDNGRLSPFVLKPLPDTLIWLSVSPAVPELLILTVCELVDPTGTLPKLTVVGVKLNPAWTPVPLTATTELAPCELVTVKFPVTFSAAFGLKVIFIAFA